MSDKLEATAISSDFKIVQKINGTTKAISASSVSYDEETKTVKLTVPTISSTEQNQTVSYTVGYKETAVVNSNSFVIPKVGELGVDSVTALSSTQIKVVFNQEVNATSAAKTPTALAKYKLGTADKDGKIENEADLPSGTNLSLQSDNKTLIITLDENGSINNVFTNGQLDNNTGYILEVSKDILPVSGKAPTKDIEVPFILKDNVAPKISSISINEQEELEIVFDEKLNTQAVDVTINGHTESVTPAYVQVIGASEVTIDKADLVDSAKFNLTTGKTYNIVVSKGEDAYGKEMKIHRSKFTYTSAAEAPSVKSVKAIDESTFLIEFSEPVQESDGTVFGNNSVQVSKGAKQYTATVVTASDTVANAYEVTFSPTDIATNDAIYDRYKNETSIELDVYIKDIKDLAGNITPASRHSVMLKKDTNRPVVVKTINKNNGVVELTFNKDLATAVDADFVAAKAYVLKSNGVKENITNTNVTVNGRVVEFDFSSLNLPDGNYTLVLEEGAVIDNTLNGGNKNSEIQVPFVSTDDGLEGKLEITKIDADATPGVIEIEFDQKISYESAAKSSNYVIDGKAIPAASKFELDSDGKILSITLPEGTYKKTEDLDMVINGVRNLAGTLMDEHEEVVTVAENEEIKLQSAKVVNGELILTFNENVNALDIGANAFDETHFIVKANGVDVVIDSAMDYDAVKAANDEEVFTKNQLKLKADTGFSLATGTITVKLDGAAITTDDIVDAAGNKVQLDGKIHTATR